MKLTKSKLAELIKAQCDVQVTSEAIKKMMFKSFVKDDAHFQITYKGFQLLKYAKFKTYKIRLNKVITMKAMLNLDRMCPSPYYLPKNKKYIYLFAEKPAVVLQMLDGDIDNFQM
jgi:hypothetical protein